LYSEEERGRTLGEGQHGKGNKMREKAENLQFGDGKALT